MSIIISNIDNNITPCIEPRLLGIVHLVICVFHARYNLQPAREK